MTSTKKSIGINFVAQYLELSIQFIGVLILARLLTPADTGVYSVAAFLMILLHMFRDFGVVNYVIQEVDLTHEKIQSAFGVAIILALMVALIMWLSSDAVAQFYDNPSLKSILHVMALSFAVSPFGSLLFGLYRREMQFTTIFYIKIASAVCHVLVATVLAYRGFGALSLAWANFAGILSFGVVANIFRPKDLPFLPRFTNIGKIISFGGISSIGNAANAIGTNSPDLVIAKTIDMAAVGYFSRGNGLVQLFAKLIESALTPIVLPYFSQLKRDGADLKQPYLLAVNYLTILAWPFFSVMAIVAFQIINVLYGAQWNASVPIVRMLCLAGAVTSMSIFAGHVMIANGQVRQATFAQLLSQPIKVIAILVASRYGVMGISIAIILGECITFFIINKYLQMTIGVTITELILACLRSGMVTACSIAGPLTITLLWTTTHNNQALQLIVAIFTAAIGWLIGVAITKHPLYGHIAEFLNAGYFPPPAVYKGKWTIKRLLYSFIKFMLYQLGIMHIYHRMRNKNALTVVLFHRVLPFDLHSKLGANPTWTISTDTFRQCLMFLKKHYQVITLEDVYESHKQGKKLPACSILITFDDGWADTAQFAQPILEEFKIRSAVFVSGSIVEQNEPFWQEAVYCTLSQDPRNIKALNMVLSELEIELTIQDDKFNDIADIQWIIRQLEKLPAIQLQRLAKGLHIFSKMPPSMLSKKQLINLSATQSIGSHGHSHHPLTKVADPYAEVNSARNTLAEYVNIQELISMSFPHGSYNESVVEACRAAGIELLFSSDSILNQKNQNKLEETIFGRIAVSEHDIIDKLGRFHPFMLAFCLFNRPISTIRYESAPHE
ncbi:oligosaccharide flippase family protein [Undibacterium sp. SXout20W]|uniref:oligosaccharide flippase family protein n=1 Tax=Undibacterium sp. SXout20W TaxID=3413051 RepID=UPI003BF3E36D